MSSWDGVEDLPRLTLSYVPTWDRVPREYAGPGWVDLTPTGENAPLGRAVLGRWPPATSATETLVRQRRAAIYVRKSSFPSLLLVAVRAVIWFAARTFSKICQIAGVRS